MVYSIKIACLKVNLKLVRDFLTQVLDEYVSSEEEINLLLVAVDEVCANLIIHSHHCNPNEFIEIKCYPNNENEIIFEIWDSDKPQFDFSGYALPDIQQLISEKKSGGIGLILVRRIVDQINFERVGEKNVCKMSKKIALKPHSAND
jgi:serine/threonine-protein kinase RsbW